MKRFLSLILGIFLITPFFTGCNQFQAFMQPYYDDMNLAVEYAEQFIIAVANDDFETARKYLHPDIRNTEGIPKNCIYELEEKYHFDFSDGVVIDHTIGTSISIGSNDSEYALGFSLIIGTEDFQLYFIVTRNANGFGISKITQYRPKGI